MSWDHASDALERIAEASRWHDSGRPAGPGPATERWKAAELRRAEEDEWLRQQRELARIPACPCDHPPGWHFSGAEVAIMFLIIAAIGLVAWLS